MKALSTPLVSVVMSVFNGEDYLKESIESILEQSYQNFEFIIINDCSNDSSLSVIKAYDDPRIRLIENEENLGLTKSLNKGISQAIGHYIARHDADDIALPKRFELQVAYLNSNPNVVVLGGQSINIDEKGQRVRTSILNIRPTETWALRWFCMFESPFIHSAVMMRKSVIWDEIGGYNESFRTNQDFELWSRLIYKYDCANLRVPILKFRRHTQSVSANYGTRSLQNKELVYKRAFETGGIEVSDEWQHFYSNLGNSDVGFSPAYLLKVPRYFKQLYQQFVESNQLDRSNLQAVKYQRDRIATYMAYFLARKSKKSSINLFWMILLSNPSVFIPYLFRYMALLLMPKTT